jgi:hypothetical protein
MRTSVIHRLTSTSRRTQEELILSASVVGVALFVAARWLFAAHRDLSRFVVAGSRWTSRTSAPKYLYVFPHASGYDGQFYWRLAANPTHLQLTRYLGVRIDSYYRLNRIFFPALVWLVSFGQHQWVAAAMVVVNAAAIVALVSLGLRATRHLAMSPLWSGCVLLVPGLVGSLSRDLTEALTCALGLAAIVAYREKKWWLAAAAWSAAVLTRETMLVAVAVYAVYSLVALLRRSRSLQWCDVAWIVPGIVFVLWQFVVRVDVGVVPIFSSAGSGDVGVPFWGFVHSIPSWFSPRSTHQLLKGLLYCVQTASVVVVLWLAWLNRRTVRTVEFYVVVAFAALLVCETTQGWSAPLDARYAAFPMVVSWLQLVEGGNRTWLRRGVVFVAPVVAATVLWRIAVI